MRLRLVIALAAVLLAVGALVLIALEPTTVFNVNGTSLGSSLARERNAVGGTCDETVMPEKWLCAVDLTGSGVNLRYRMTADGEGCWRATEKRPKELPERTLSGCVNLADYLAPKKPGY